MKLSDVPTGLIIAKATTNSEWDSCDFAIIDFNSEFIKNIADEYKRLDRVYPHCIAYLPIYADNADFFIHQYDDKHPVIEEFINDGNRQWSYIEITEEEMETFTRPENAIRDGITKISERVQYVAYGKHTSEEFWTDGIPVEELFKTETIGG